MIRKLIYPNTCGFCDKIIDAGYICSECKRNIPYWGNRYIPYKQGMYFDELYCNYEYTGIVRTKLLSYKFSHKKYLSKTFAEGMLDRFKIMAPDFDIIIPVPIHKVRKKQRGYNQSALIAKILSNDLNIFYNKNVLIKKVNNVAQSRLNKAQREKNVQNVFIVKNSDIINGKVVLLIDDIYTTGATVNECSRILKSVGAKKVFVYTVAKATINTHID